MTEWILLTMICVRWCEPVYAEVKPSREICQQSKPLADGNYKYYCVPLIKNKDKP